MAIDAAVQKQVVGTLVRDLDENYVFRDVAKEIGAELDKKLSSYSDTTSARAIAHSPYRAPLIVGS
ncbi:MAG: hypothetical protein OEQ28_10210 [Acidobacteriota bacterium]|nr:hypothetical protein [Acidobacteriota bacterium]